MKNSYKENKKEESPSKEKKKVFKPFADLITGRFLSKDNVIRSMPYLFFLTFLGICYIANGYYAEKTVKEIYKINTELKELRSEYITIKSELNYRSKQSQVAKAIRPYGLEESIIPPHKIEISKEEVKKIMPEKE